MKTLHTLSLAVVMAAACAAPAFADNVVVLGEKSPPLWSGIYAQQPTYFLNLESGHILPEGLGYLSAGTGRANLAGQAVNYARGMGAGGELSVLAGLALTPTVGANVGVGYKQQFVHTDGFALAGNLSLAGMNLGAANALFLTAGVPMTFGTDMVRFTIDPRLTLPTVNAGTAGGMVDVPLGLQAPILPYTALLAQVTPGLALGSNAFTLGGGLGFRFSPTPRSHVDIGLGNLNFVPAFGTALALSTSAHVGF